MNAQMAKMDEQHKQTKQNHYGPPQQSSYNRNDSNNIRITITIVIRTTTNDPEMIALDQTRVIAPTPNRAVRAAQVAITTETVHTSTMTKRSTKHTR
jgi:hypothetical protein